MQRLEEKFADIKFENQILRQRALLKTPIKRIADILSTPEKNQSLENGHHLSEENGANEPINATAAMYIASGSPFYPNLQSVMDPHPQLLV